MKKVQAQRKFAQGVYMPTNSNINTVVDRRTDVGTGKDPKNVFHNNTSAKTLLDIVSFESFHTHTPIVLIERLCEDNLRIADDSESINSNNNLLQPVVKKTKPKFNSRTLKNSETMILRSRTQPSKKWNVREVSYSPRKKVRRMRQRTVEEYQSEDETPLKFLARPSKSKEQPPSCNKGTASKLHKNDDKPLRFLARPSTSKEVTLSGNKGATKSLSEASTSKEQTPPNKQHTSNGPMLEFLSDVRGLAGVSDTEYIYDETECQIDDDEYRFIEDFIDNTNSQTNDNSTMTVLNPRAYLTSNTIEMSNPDVEEANNAITDVIQSIEDPDLIDNMESPCLTSNTVEMPNPDLEEANNASTDVIQSIEDPGLIDDMENNMESACLTSNTVEMPNSDVEEANNASTDVIQSIEDPGLIDDTENNMKSTCLTSNTVEMPNPGLIDDMEKTMKSACLTSNTVEIPNPEANNANTDVIQSIEDPGLIENSSSNIVQSGTSGINNDDMEENIENASLDSEVECEAGSELESVYDSERESETVQFIEESMDVSEEEEAEDSDDHLLNEMALWSGVKHSEQSISEPNVSGNNTENEGLRQNRIKACKAISMKNLCKMLTRCDNVNDFGSEVKEHLKNRCCKCINCKTIYRSYKIMILLKGHQEKYHRDQLCRLACIRKKNQEAHSADSTDSKSNVEIQRSGGNIMTIIKQELLGDSENTIAFNKIKNLTRDIIIGMDIVRRSASPIGENCDSDASLDAPILIETPGRDQGILDPQPGPSGTVIRSKLVDAPVFRPTIEEFHDPVAYFEKIMPIAAKYGLCKVIPPTGFQPICNLNDNMRFNVTSQYIDRVFNRWGENIRALFAMRVCAASQKTPFNRPPLVGGLELDLVKMYKAMQREGGIKTFDKKQWQKIAEELHCLCFSNPDKILDGFYLKYLVPYDTFSKRARQEIINNLEVLWRKKNQKMLERAMNPLHRQKRLLAETDSSSDEDDDDNSDPYMIMILKEIEDCVVKGRNMNLGTFKKVARNASRIYAPKDGSAAQIETSYWNIVENGNVHVCVNSASIDTGSEGYGFTKHQHEPFGSHPWNLKVLSQNKGNVLRLLGSVIGLTVPTLNLGMLYSTSCWHRDPHGLPWIEYMHEGAQKIWYAISDEESYRFRKAVETVSPMSCQNKSIWLPSDVTMIPPKLLLEHGVSLSKVVQNPGEFIIVFPKSYSCSINTGYTVSESVYFATNSWVNSIHHVFQELRDSCEPTMFSLEHLMFSAARDLRSSSTVLQLVCTKLISIVNEELDNRNKARLKNLVPATIGPRKNITWSALADDECQICRTTLYLSRVKGLFQKSLALCITHALRVLDNPNITKRDVDLCQYEIFFTNLELENIINIAKKRLISIKPRRNYTVNQSSNI